MLGRGLGRGLGLGALVVLVCGGPGCETTQPETVPTQNAVLEMQASANVNIYDVWDFFVDSRHCSLNQDIACVIDTDCPPTETCSIPGDGQPDDVDFDGIPDEFLVCEATGQSHGALGPWPYVGQVDLIRAGTATAVSLLPGGDASVLAAPLSTYLVLGVTAPQPSFADVRADHVFLNPRRVDATNEEVLLAPKQPAGSPPLGPGGADTDYCPFGFQEVTGPTFPFTMNNGDTLVVKARKGSDQGSAFLGEPTLTGVLTLDGQAVDPTSGISFTNELNGDIAFTYTSK